MCLRISETTLSASIERFLEDFPWIYFFFCVLQMLEDLIEKLLILDKLFAVLRV